MCPHCFGFLLLINNTMYPIPASRNGTLMPAWPCHREVVNNLELAARLGVQAHPNAKHDNFVDESVQIGSKSTVAAGCMVGPGATLA